MTCVVHCIEAVLVVVLSLRAFLANWDIIRLWSGLGKQVSHLVLSVHLSRCAGSLFSFLSRDCGSSPFPTF